MRRWRVRLGFVAGLLAAAIILAVWGGRPDGAPPARPTGPVLSDCGGAIRDLVIHYVPEAHDAVAPVYRDLLRHLPADVTVHVVCARQADLDALARAVAPVACRLRPVLVSHRFTFWSRDRWLALAPVGGGPVSLLCPRGEEGAELWEDRAGDERIAGDIASALAPDVVPVRSPLYFDGGDFDADERTAFVSPAVLRRNVQRTVRTREELLHLLRAALQRDILLLEPAPDHHVGMYMMPAGDGRVLVGDPAAAKHLLGESPTVAGAGHLPALCPPLGPDFSPGTQDLFDAVARQCAAAGYRVVRIPVVPGKDGRTYVTYVNVLMDHRASGRVVYMPTYRESGPLNQAAADVWRGLGYEVRTVDCTSVYVHFGALHCLANVLRRSS